MKIAKKTQTEKTNVALNKLQAGHVSSRLLLLRPYKDQSYLFWFPLLDLWQSEKAQKVLLVLIRNNTESLILHNMVWISTAKVSIQSTILLVDY